MRWRVAAFWILAVGTLGTLAGCGASDGQKRNRVSGGAKFDGQPIGYGQVIITPDGEKKNSGAQGIAIIRDGKYDTAAPGGKGYGGGPAVIRVTGFDKEGGKLLCEQEFQVDLPPGDATHDIDVPKEAKKAGKDI